MNTTKRLLAATEILLVLPAALFMAALFVRNLQPAPYEPATTARHLVEWFSAHPPVGLQLFLIALPFAAFVIGCATVLGSWRRDAEAPAGHGEDARHRPRPPGDPAHRRGDPGGRMQSGHRFPAHGRGLTPIPEGGVKPRLGSGLGSPRGIFASRSRSRIDADRQPNPRADPGHPTSSAGGPDVEARVDVPNRRRPGPYIAGCIARRAPPGDPATLPPAPRASDAISYYLEHRPASTPRSSGFPLEASLSNRRSGNGGWPPRGRRPMPGITVCVSGSPAVHVSSRSVLY